MLKFRWALQAFLAVCAMISLAVSDRAIAQETCETARPNELLQQLRESTPIRGTFTTRFLPAGSEAHLVLRIPPGTVSAQQKPIYRALVQHGSRFGSGKLSLELSDALQKTQEPVAQPDTGSVADPNDPAGANAAGAPKLVDLSKVGSLAQSIPVLAATSKPDDSEALDVALLVPADNAWWQYRHFIVFACSGTQTLFIADAEARVSNQPASIILAIALILILAACAIRTVAGRPIKPKQDGGMAWMIRHFNPLYLFTGPNGKASLSIFQIMFYTLIVVYLTVVFLGRTGALSTLSTDVAMLLGIAVGGSIGGALMNQSLAGLSAEGDTWLRSKKWLPEGDKKPDPHLSDLITTGGTLDIYRFQSLAFNLVVGAALLIGGLSTLANFTLPAGLLALLGLSQVAYIGGKAVTPKISDLDNALKNAANTEKAFLAAVSEKASADKIAVSDLAAAKKAAPTEYEAFRKAAFDAREYFRAIIGEPASGWPPEPAFLPIAAPPPPAPPG